MTDQTIAIIGAGYSGTVLALNLLRLTGPSTRIVLIERSKTFGLGQAYSTTNPDHLLNVPLTRMSAFATQPSHFQDWLLAQPNPPAGPFVPRLMFGRYIRQMLEQAQHSAGARLELVQGAVTGLTTDPSPVLRLADGTSLAADMAVLAVGNYLPAPVLPKPALDSPAYRGNPWAPDSTAGIAPDAPVLIVGTGLTMVDTVITLLDLGHRGPINALSRRGLAPLPHAPAPTVSLPPLPDYPHALLALLRCVRADATACTQAGGTWQDALDRFRHHIQDTWQAATARDRRQFLRHLRPWWEIHRHRIAGPVADRIAAARASGQLQILAGRISTVTATDEGLDVQYRPRGCAEMQQIQAARVINCTGPAANYRHIPDPLLQALLAEELVCPDASGLGLAVTEDCALIGADGVARPIFAMGPATRGRFWEITSVPDIRVQIDALAKHLAQRTQAPAVLTPQADPLIS